MNDFVFNLVTLVLALFIGFIIIAGSICFYQAYEDSQVCKQQTGLYSGCELKQRESTYRVDVRK